jgi:hypothetical protein
MSNKGLLLVILNSDSAAINRVAEAMGRGPESLSIPVTAANPPVHGSPVDGWAAFDMGDYSGMGKWTDLKGDAPTVDDNGNPIDWSAWGMTPAEVEAATAELQVFACDTDGLVPDFIDATLGSFLGHRRILPPEGL